MKIESISQYIDKFIWRCRSKNHLHDIKKNIRTDYSIIKGYKIPLNVLYYLTFKCFINNYSINKTYITNKYLCELIKAPYTSRIL